MLLRRTLEGAGRGDLCKYVLSPLGKEVGEMMSRAAGLNKENMRMPPMIKKDIKVAHTREKGRCIHRAAKCTTQCMDMMCKNYTVRYCK